MELSGYVIAALMLAYTIFALALLTVRGGRGRAVLDALQTAILFGVHFVCFFSLAAALQSPQTYFAFYLVQAGGFLAVQILARVWYPHLDRLLLNNACLLIAIGLAVNARLSYGRAVRQFLMAAAGAVLVLALPALVRRLQRVEALRRLAGKVLALGENNAPTAARGEAAGRRLPETEGKPEDRSETAHELARWPRRTAVPFNLLFWKKLTYFYGGAGILLLGAVLLLGTATHGSKITFTLLGVTLQPSEFVKLLFLLFLAGALRRGADFRQTAVVSLAAAAHVAILVLSRDLGSALIFFVVWLLVLWFASGKWYYLAGGGAIGALGAAASYRLFRHVQVRVQAFRDPWSVIDDMGYQITQSLFSISNGGAFGQGMGQGDPGRIPYVESDFIFAAIAEELGIVSAVCLLLVCLVCFGRLLQIALRQRDRFCRLLAFGAATAYIFQTFLTVGGEVKFIPLTGVTLPFVSYGGSSLLSTIFLFAMIEGVVCVQATHEARRAALRHPARAERRRAVGENTARREYDEGAEADSRRAGGVQAADQNGGSTAAYRERGGAAAAMRRTGDDRAAAILAARRQERGERLRLGLTGGLFPALFLAMTFSFVTYAEQNREQLFENSYNTRPALLLEQNARGRILAADGQVLAQTKITEVTDGAAAGAAGATGAETKSGAAGATGAQAESGAQETAEASSGVFGGAQRTFRQTRDYPFGSVFAHIVGYDTMGRSGIEAHENYDLVHSDLTLEQKAPYAQQGLLFPGNDVVTTLEPDLQQAAYKAMGLYRGAIVVSDPRTGAILAMVSKPDFDPNEIEAQWQTLSQDEQSATLLNRASQGLYPPGSTFKIVDAVEYLEEHPDDWEEYSFDCTGSFTKDGETIHCFHNESHGQVDFTSSFARSCNSSFASMGLSFDQTHLADNLQKMMFGEELPYALPSAVSTTVMEEKETPLSVRDMMQLSIGQGETGMSPLHLNLLTAAIANGGEVMKPYVIDRVQTAAGEVLSQTQPQAYRRLMSEETAAQMRALMEAVVEKGTASKLQGYGYTAAGKTGSAEYEDGSTDSHAWFTGFAPAEHPEVAVTVIIEGAGSGGDYAVPMARRVFDAYFSQQEADS